MFHAGSPPRAPTIAIGEAGSRIVPVLGLLRPRQWIKNLLLFAALVFAKQLFVPSSLALAVLAFVAFCVGSVITSYSIHYTKLYDGFGCQMTLAWQIFSA